MSGNRSSNSLLWSIKYFFKRKFSPAFKFDHQYSAGKWDELYDVKELARYSIITGYIQQFFPKGMIADLGCGNGVLASKCTTLQLKKYLGVDFSAVAIEKAKTIGGNHFSYEVGDLNEYIPDSHFDVFVFNESIYYLNNPKLVLKRFSERLNPGGIFIFSIVDKNGDQDMEMWQEINECLQHIDTTRVFNKFSTSWTVGVYQPK